jgi:uncharacterized membrane protein YdjX (TVP38/TMEM64 family)
MPAKPKTESGRSRWRWIVGASATLAVCAALYFAWSAWGHAAVINWMEQVNPFWFFAIVAIIPGLGIPITPLFILAGATFGTRIGLIGSLVALAAHLALCYWIARAALRRQIKALLRRFDYQLPHFGDERRSAIRFTLMLKLAPGVPTFIKNYALGVAGVPFLLFFVSSMVITGAYAVALVVLGESLLDHDTPTLVVVGVILAVIIGGLWWWRKRRTRAGERAR